MHQDLLRLVNFVQGRITLDDWLRDVKNSGIPVGVEEMPEGTRFHEGCHQRVWKQHGVKASFYRSEDGFYYTSPDIHDIKTLFSKIGKNRFIEIFKLVVSAPVMSPEELEGTDMNQFLILNGSIKNEEQLIAYRLSKIEN